MDGGILVVSPETKEIIPYYVKDWESTTFSLVINDLQKRRLPSSLILYDGTKYINIKPDDPINLYYFELPGLLLTFSKELTLPILNIPEDHNLTLLLSPDLSQIIPYLDLRGTTINGVLDYLMDGYGLYVSITKYSMILNKIISVKVNDSISRNLTSSDILVLNDKSSLIQKIENLEKLSDERILSFLLRLPVNDIYRICHLKKNLKDQCQSESLWKELVKRDFGLTDKGDVEYWRDYYQIVRKDVDTLLVIGARQGDLSLINEALNFTLDISAEALNEALLRKDKYMFELMLDYARVNNPYISLYTFLLEAAEGGHSALLEWLLGQEKIYELLSNEKNLFEVLDLAIKNGHLDFVKICLDFIRMSDDELYDLLIMAVISGYRDVVEFFSNKIEEVIPNDLPKRINYYNDALEVAAREGHLDIINLLLGLGANNYNPALRAAAGRGYDHVIQILLEEGADDFDGAIENAIENNQEETAQFLLEKKLTLFRSDTISDLIF